MNQYGCFGGVHLGLHPTEVVEDWPSILWNTVVWPGSKVELGHLQWSPFSLVTLWGVEDHTGTAGMQEVTKMVK